MFASRVGLALMCVGVLVVLLGATPSGSSVTIADTGPTPVLAQKFIWRWNLGDDRG